MIQLEKIRYLLSSYKFEISDIYIYYLCCFFISSISFSKASLFYKVLLIDFYNTLFYCFRDEILNNRQSFSISTSFRDFWSSNMQSDYSFSIFQETIGLDNQHVVSGQGMFSSSTSWTKLYFWSKTSSISSNECYLEQKKLSLHFIF